LDIGAQRLQKAGHSGPLHDATSTAQRQKMPDQINLLGKETEGRLKADESRHVHKAFLTSSKAYLKAEEQKQQK
jgi:hypothetical protein